MLLTVLLLLTLSFAKAEQECPEIDKNYILGNYKTCYSSTEASSSIRCRYVKALCALGESAYEKSRYDLSLISADIKEGSFNEFNGLALTSLAEVAFLEGDYKRAKTLSSAVNDVLIKKLPASYPYSISEILLIKSYFDSKDVAAANKKLEMMKAANVDRVLFSSLDPWQ